MSSTADLAFRARRAFVGGEIRDAVVLVADGRITEVTPWSDEPDAAHVIDVPADAILLPGLVDSHVHVNEPGRTHWEGFASATRAAAAGGVTTIVDMPLNSIPATTTVEALAVKRQSAGGRVAVDVGFWGGAVPESLGHLRGMKDAGVYGFKCFLAPSGVDEFGHLDPAQLRAALAEIAEIDSLLIVHAEDPDDLTGDGALGTRYVDFLASRPPASEEHAIQRVIDGMRETGARAHILHLSDAAALPMIRAAKAEGLPLTVETCPHYLTIRADEIPDAATEFKCCPPIRDDANQDALWEGVLDGSIDLIVTDHSPSTIDLKRGTGGDFGLAWGGIAGLQLGLVAVWTEARRRGIPLERVLPRLTSAPADLVGMSDRGRIAPGAVASFAVFAPDEEQTIDAASLEHKNPISAYDHKHLTGVVRETWLRGALAYTAAGGATDPRGDLL